MDLASKLFKGDRVIWIIFMFLCLISVVEVFSATSTIAYKNANHWAPIVRHATFLLGGFVLVLLLHNVPCRFFPAFILLLPVSVLMLLVTPFVGINANDAHRWLEIFGIQFQPSEFESRNRPAEENLSADHDRATVRTLLRVQSRSSHGRPGNYRL